MEHPATANPPIPTPSYLRQYRAIGLIYGQYQPRGETLTQGDILTPEGTVVDAVILGRLISLAKNHLDFQQPHLWVVYPRTGIEDDSLHLQIVGVWEPQTLHGQQNPTITPKTAIFYQSGYFSIRGEVVFSSPEKMSVVVKIRQAPRQKKQPPKSFKLKLQGCLPDSSLSRFWDLQVRLRGDILVLESGTDLGVITKKAFPPSRTRLIPKKKSPPLQSF